MMDGGQHQSNCSHHLLSDADDDDHADDVGHCDDYYNDYENDLKMKFFLFI